MTVKGLENGSYYLGNPIKVEVSGLRYGLRLEVSYRGKTFEFWYSENAGIVEMDFSKIVSGIIPRIKSLKKLSELLNPEGSYKLRFILSDANLNSESIGLSTSIECNFLLGGKIAYAQNIPTRNNLNVGSVFYIDFPNMSFSYLNGIISGGNVDIDNSFDDIYYTSHLKNPIFLIFRNLYGGYSRLLFETFDEQRSIRGNASFVTLNNIGVDIGEVSSSFLCKTQLKRVNYVVAYNLILSDEVYIYNRNILDVSDELIRVSINSNANINFADQTTDFNVELTLLHNYD